MLHTASTLDTPDLSGQNPVTFDPLDLADKLAFLACYSHHTIALQSDQQEHQAGELYQACQDVCQTVLLSAPELPTQVSEQHSKIAEAFGLRVDLYPEMALSDFVAAQPVRPLLILTHCDRMSETQLANVFGLADRTGLGLTLFSGVSLKSRKASQRATNILHTSVRQLMNRDVKQLLRQRAKQEVQLSESDIQKVLDRSRGNLDKADAMVSELVTSQQDQLGLPLAHMSMVVLFLAVAVGAFVMAPGQEGDLVSAPVALEVTPANRVSTRREDGYSSLTTDQDDKSVASSPAIEPVVTASNLVAQVPASTASAPLDEGLGVIVVDVAPSLAAPETTSLEESLSRAGPVQLVSPDPNAWINNLPATASGSLNLAAAPDLSQREWLTSAPNSAYTLQIIGSHDESRIVQFMQR